MTIRTLRVPCETPGDAEDAAIYLRDEEGVEVTGTDGRYLLVPAGWSPMFVWLLAEAVQTYADDEELARWAGCAASARSDDDPNAIRNQRTEAAS